MKDGAVFSSEADFRVWFEANLDRFDIKEIVLSQEPCPDYVVMMNDGRPAKIEAELFAINFKYHGHDPAKADYIVACYSKTEVVEGVPVMAVHRLWCFDVDPLDPLSPEGTLEDDEARLLSGIHQSGGISLSALSDGAFSGDQEIWIRFSPDQIAAIPRSSNVDSVFDVLTPRAKKWIRKSHHLLIGVGISEDGCRLLESLERRRLIEYRPISVISSALDGALVDHEAWLPVEIRATRNAWKYQKEAIMKYLGGKS